VEEENSDEPGQSGSDELASKGAKLASKGAELAATGEELAVTGDEVAVKEAEVPQGYDAREEVPAVAEHMKGELLQEEESTVTEAPAGGGCETDVPSVVRESGDRNGSKAPSVVRESGDRNGSKAPSVERESGDRNGSKARSVVRESGDRNGSKAPSGDKGGSEIEPPSGDGGD